VKPGKYMGKIIQEDRATKMERGSFCYVLGQMVGGEGGGGAGSANLGRLQLSACRTQSRILLLSEEYN